MHSKSPADLLYRYYLYGWLLKSERPLPMMVPLPPGEAAGESETMELRFGPVMPPQGAPLYDDGFITLYASDVALLNYPDMRVLITGGRHIQVDAAGAVCDAHLHTYLSGPVMSVASHQRGLPPLHACGLEIGGKGVAVAGHSGSGKSTTTRALLLHGHRMVCDDHARIDPVSRLMQAGCPSMKLWQNSAAHLGDRLDATLQVTPSVEKFHFPLEARFRSAPIALSQVVILQPDPALEHPVLVTLSVQQAAMALHRMVHRWRVAHAIDQGAATLEWALALSRKIPVAILQRPNDLGQLDLLCAMIEELAASANGVSES